jgi:hypothetical protein
MVAFRFFKAVELLLSAALVFCFSSFLKADDCKEYYGSAIISIQKDGDTIASYPDKTTSQDYTCVNEGASIDFEAVSNGTSFSAIFLPRHPFSNGRYVHKYDLFKHDTIRAGTSDPKKPYEFTACWDKNVKTTCMDPRIVVGGVGSLVFYPGFLFFARNGDLVKAVEIENSGPATVSFVSFVISDPEPFTIAGRTCDAPLEQKAFCEVRVQYRPGKGPAGSSLQVTYQSGDRRFMQSVPLEGN